MIRLYTWQLTQMRTWICFRLTKNGDMECNPSKCQVLCITRSRKPLQSLYTFHGQVLETVSDVKYLGITISKDLNWNTHVNNITAKAKTSNKSVKELAYNTLVRPQVKYASSVWSPSTKQNISKIEMIQRRAARWVKHNYSPYESITRMLDDLGWRSKLLENRCAGACLIMFHRIIYGYGYVAIQVPERSSIVTCTLLPSDVFIPNYASYYQYSFYPAAIVLWNTLDPEIALISDPKSFKERVRAISHPSP